jgi:hypothetical protein
MKRILVIAAILCIALIGLQSCSSTKNATTVKRGNVTGTWVLNNISYEGIPSIAVKSFLGEASASCFNGSTWSLTNSGNGSYILSGGGEGCVAKTQSIFWSASPADQTFQYKKLEDGDKAKNVDQGYRLMLSSASGDAMTLKSPIEYGTGVAYVVLNFSKATK